MILNFTSLNRHCLIKQANRAEIASAVISLTQNLIRKNIKCESENYSTSSASDIFILVPSSKEHHVSDNIRRNKRP